MPARGSESAVAALARTAIDRGVAALAASDIVTALRWLERAQRLVPQDPNTKLTLATALLPTDPDRAASLFADVAQKHDVRQAWLGLAAARLHLTGTHAATGPLAAVLSRHAFDPDTAALAEKIGGTSGWCALRPDGTLEIHSATPVQVTLDGKPHRDTKLPAGWARAHTIEVRCGNTPLLGSPIRIDAIRRLAGCVETWEGGLRGWAWHPGDPATPPELTLTYANGPRQTVIAHDESVPVPHNGPLARPRIFHLAKDDLLASSGPIHVTGPDGKDMLGSPLDPFADGAAHVFAALRIAAAYPSWSGGRIGDDAIPSPALRADAPVPDRPTGADGRRRAATVVIPVHDGGSVVLACLASALACKPRTARILVVDDASSDPAMIAALDSLVRDRKITLLRHTRPQGFPAAANAGIHLAKGRDVVLLNSDTLVPSGWLERLRDAAYSSPDIGTVTPLSNDASILSYPGPAGSNPKPDQAATNRLDRLAACANGPAVVDIPVGVGFCLYLRRDCLNATGVFRADLFAQGYGEENDLCLRARRLGWRNVALTGLFVGHHGGATFSGPAFGTCCKTSGAVEAPSPQAVMAVVEAPSPQAVMAVVEAPSPQAVVVGEGLPTKDRASSAPRARDGRPAPAMTSRSRCDFGNDSIISEQALTGPAFGGPTYNGSAEHLRQRNGRLVEQLHPGYQTLIDRFLKADPLAESRRRIDLQAWKARGRPWRQAAILVTHDDGGGVEQRLRLSAQLHADAGRRPIMLRPAETAAGDPAIAVCDGLTNELPNLVFAMPRERQALLHLLRAAKADRIEAHQLADHPPSIYDLIAQLGLPYDVHVHDYALFCPRVSLVAADNRYCGEPDLRGCEACVIDHGHFLKETIGVAELRFRSAGFLSGARRVIVPANDVGLRIRRHFPTLSPVTIPHEDDNPTARVIVSPKGRNRNCGGGRPSVCVVGAIGVHKGYDILLACARDAGSRDLDLEFIVVGHTIDDNRMMQTERVFVTGQFNPGQAVDLIAAQHASLGFVPSICPETWCLGLGDLWQAGLRVAAFDIGAPAERIRRTRHGIVLPLGLPASAINNRLLAAIRAAAH